MKNNIIMSRIFILVLLFIGLSAGAFAQKQNEIEVRGIVTDDNNEPLIGVTIVLKESPTTGTISDSDGKFKLKMAPFNRLIISYIGFETLEVLVKEEPEIKVVLKERVVHAIDEVVVTGTGIQKKLNVTGAVTTVNIEDLKTTPSSSIANALAGNVPGVLAMMKSGQPGDNVSEFWIRGISTFGAGKSALVLVDGFERDLTQLNVEDIESFSVLKDASETAIYGSRGANGVILINTKRGKEGKITIDAKIETIYNTRTYTPEFVDGYTYAQMMNESRVTRNLSPLFIDNELNIIRHGLDPDLLPNVNWKDELLKDGAWTHRVSLNMNGGGSNTRYFVSTSFVSEDGMYKTDETIKKDYKTNANFYRWNYRMNADIDITKTTLLRFGVSGNLRKQNQPGVGTDVIWGSIMGYTPITSPVKYSNGYIPSYSEERSQVNPWTLATQTGYKERWWNEVNTTVNLEQKLDFVTKGLKFIGRFGFDTYNENTIDKFKMPELWKAERFRNTAGEIVYKRVAKPIEMSQTAGSSGYRKEFLEAEFAYDRTFGAHNVSGTFKYMQDSKVTTQNIGEDIKNSIANRHQGISGRVAYNWNNRYFINFNFGYNGSENFAKGHRYGFFPAVSGAWNISEEPFLEDVQWLGMFKVRYSWGKVGNDIMDVRFPYLYEIGTEGHQYQWGDLGFGNAYTVMRYRSPGSKKIGWEVAKKHDLGIDLSILNDQFSMTVDYYNERRDGIFLQRMHLPETAIFDANPYANVGSVRTKGVDGHFSAKQKINAVTVTVRGNMTLSENEVLERDEAYNVYPYLNQKGYRVGQVTGLISEGLFKDYDEIRNNPKQTFGSVQPGDIKYKDVNGDGIIDNNDRVAIGSTHQPNIVYGLGASMSWKGIDLNVHFQGAGKNSIMLDGPAVKPFSSKSWGNILTDLEGNYWQSRDISGTPDTENVNAKYPRLSYGYYGNNQQPSTTWIRDGSYIRLKTLEAGYTFPKALTTRFRINNLRIFVIGTNLFTWSNFKLWDPELGSNNGQQYPIAKSVTLGLSINL